MLCGGAGALRLPEGGAITRRIVPSLLLYYPHLEHWVRFSKEPVHVYTIQDKWGETLGAPPKRAAAPCELAFQFRLGFASFSALIPGYLVQRLSEEHGRRRARWEEITQTPPHSLRYYYRVIYAVFDRRLFLPLTNGGSCSASKMMISETLGFWAFWISYTSLRAFE